MGEPIVVAFSSSEVSAFYATALKQMETKSRERANTVSLFISNEVTVSFTTANIDIGQPESPVNIFLDGHQIICTMGSAPLNTRERCAPRAGVAE